MVCAFLPQVRGSLIITITSGLWHLTIIESTLGLFVAMTMGDESPFPLMDVVLSVNTESPDTASGAGRKARTVVVNGFFECFAPSTVLHLFLPGSLVILEV
ncbi:hypothetical protein Scep_005087 [Stephania cephalantha]|uniref:Uncharacterized protein n=1 Tax=Stephania cephalantha TaxID=152367 RepID=A0AAP0PW11_9MAGN